MERRPLALILLLAWTTHGTARAEEACAAIDRTAVASLFDGWNLSLASLDPDTVSQRYWDDAVMLPTLSNTPHTSPAMIRDHFVHFLERHPRGRIESRTVQIGCNLAFDVGTYMFSEMNESGALSEVAARYTFVYAFRNGEWKIAHHHSSAMPEVPGAAPAPRPAMHAAAATGRKLGGHDVKDTKVVGTDGSRLFLNREASPDVMEFYPPDARAKREAGKVALRVCADPDGAVVGEPKVLKSSGHDRLDSAARKWAQAAKWVPATSNLRRVEGCTEITAQFRP